METLHRLHDQIYHGKESLNWIYKGNNELWTISLMLLSSIKGVPSLQKELVSRSTIGQFILPR